MDPGDPEILGSQGSLGINGSPPHPLDPRILGIRALRQRGAARAQIRDVQREMMAQQESLVKDVASLLAQHRAGQRWADVGPFFPPRGGGGVGGSPQATRSPGGKELASSGSPQVLQRVEEQGARSRTTPDPTVEKICAEGSTSILTVQTPEDMHLVNEVMRYEGTRSSE